MYGNIFWHVTGKCKPNCQNGGTCIGVNKCRCPVGYQGNLCQQSKSNTKTGNKFDTKWSNNSYLFESNTSM